MGAVVMYAARAGVPGEKRKIEIDLTASLNGSTASNPEVTIYRARGMENVTTDLVTDTPTPPMLRTADGSTVLDFWVDLEEWTEIGRYRLRVKCDADSSGERPVEQTEVLLIQ